MKDFFEYGNREYFLVNKVIRVVRSCETKEQLKTAENFVQLAIKEMSRIAEKKYSCLSEWRACSEIYEMKEDYKRAFRSWIRKRKEEL